MLFFTDHPLWITIRYGSFDFLERSAICKLATKNVLACFAGQASVSQKDSKTTIPDGSYDSQTKNRKSVS